MIGEHPIWPTVAPPLRFAANPKLKAVPPPASNADVLVDSMSGRHCAGLSGRLRGSALREALLAPPSEGDAAAATIQWLFGSIWIQDLQKLAWRCGIPIGRLADHARTHSVTNLNVVCWLNQFAAP